MTKSTRLFTLLFVLLVGCSPAPSLHAPVQVASAPFDGTVTAFQPAGASDPGGIVTVGNVTAASGSYVPGELIATLAPDADATQVAAGIGATASAEVRFAQRYARLVLPRGAALSGAAERLAAAPGVLAVSPDWRVSPSYLASGSLPNDPDYALQWAHTATHMTEAWQTLGPSFTAANTAIAVLDTGCDVGHPEFAGRILPGINLTNEHPDTSLSLRDDLTDVVGHGTHVMGIAGAAGNNGQGVTGVAWDAKLLPIKVLGKNSGTSFGVMQGIRYAADYVSDTGAVVRVINMSLGLDGNFTTDAAFEDAMDYAWQKGIVVVVAAGNSAGAIPDPATNVRALVVSSTSRYQVGGFFTEYFSGYSNRGDRVDVAAPGGDILSTTSRFNNDVSTELGLATWAIGNTSTAIDPPYGAISGTSMSSPYVAGLAALVTARYDPYNNYPTGAFSDKVAQRIKDTADDMGAPGKDPDYGYGRVNALFAIAYPSL